MKLSKETLAGVVARHRRKGGRASTFGLPSYDP
jgi:hypothetical protein